MYSSRTPDVFFGDIRSLLHTHHPTELDWSRLRAIIARALHHPSLEDSEVEQILTYTQQSINKSASWRNTNRGSLPHWFRATPHSPPRKALALCNHIVLDTCSIMYASHELAIDFEQLLELECTLEAEQVPVLAALLVKTPRLERLTLKGEGPLSLDLEPLTSEEFKRDAPLPHLTQLEIHHAQLGSYGFEHLTGLPWLPQLRHLNLESNALEDEHLLALSQLPLEKLEALILEFNDFEREGIEALCHARPLAHLKHLNLSLCQLTAECIAPLRQATWRHTIERLDLSFNLLQEDGISALASCDFPHLHTLFIDNQEQRSARGMEALASASFLPNLKHISTCFESRLPPELWTNSLLPPMADTLEAIDLSINRLDDDLLRALGETFKDRPVKRLELSNCGDEVSAEALLALLDHANLSELASLSLSSTPLLDAHFATLHPRLERLEELHIEQLDMLGAGLAHLLSRIPPGTLRWLSAGRQKLDHTAQHELVAAFARQNLETLHMSRLEPGDDTTLLAILHVCAPTLQTLELRHNPHLLSASLEELCTQSFPALSYLGLGQSQGTNEALEHLLSHIHQGEESAFPHLKLLDWQGNEEISSELLARVPPELHIIR